MKADEDSFVDLPQVREINTAEIQKHFLTIKAEVRDLVDSELKRIKNDPNLAHLLIED